MGKALKDNEYTLILMESMQSDIKAILEIVAPAHKELMGLKESYNKDIPTMKDDIKVMKTAMTATNKNVTELDAQVTKLKAKFA